MWEWHAWCHRERAFVPRATEAIALAAPSDAIFENAVRMFAKGIPWDHKQLGPQPGESGCKASPEIIAKHLPHLARVDVGRAA
jgi:hypothetical protein